MKMLFLKGSNTYVNPMQIVSANTAQRLITTSNGRSFNLAEDELAELTGSGRLFLLKNANVYVNPMQMVTLYRAGGTANVALSNGTDYPISEEEYVGLVAFSAHEEHKKEKPEEKKDDKEEMVKKILSVLEEKKD